MTDFDGRDYFSCGDDVVVVETCCPGHGSMQIGIGRTKEAAIDSLESTPIEGHLSPRRGLEWAIGQEWFGVGVTIDDFDTL